MQAAAQLFLPHVTKGRYAGATRTLLGASTTFENATAIETSNNIHLEFQYEELLRVLAFLAATWLFGWISRRLGFPELVGNVLVGVLLGPELADVCGRFSLALMLVGEVGFLLLMLEGGLEVDIPMLLQLGHRGLGVALVGQLSSIGTAMAMMTIFGLPPKASFASGAVFAPMSTSVLLAVFKQYEMLNTPMGQLCLVAAVFDDCYGLILLSELRAVKEGGIKNIIVPLVTSLSWLAIVGFFAVRYFPNLLNKHILPRVPKKNRKGFLLGLCFSIAIGLASALYYTYASRYLGVFLAGLFFCTSPALQHEIWSAQVKKIHRWLIRIFFAATVAFEIPITKFWTRRVWTKTAAFLVPFLSKGIVGIFAPAPLKEEFWKVAIAMMSRGEMSFVINRMARAQLELIDDETGSAIMLAVVIAIFIVPLMLSMTLRFFAKKREKELQERTKQRGPDSIGASYYRLVIRTPHTFGLLDRTMRILHLHHMEVLDFRMEYEEDCTILEAYLLDSQSGDSLDIRDKHLQDLRESIKHLLVHDPNSVAGTELMVRMFADLALEAGGKELTFMTHHQDHIFEKAGVGVMVAVWAPWVDDGFLAHHTYNPIPMLDVNDGARASELYRRSQDASLKGHLELVRNSMKRNSKDPSHRRANATPTQPRELKAADVLRLARKSLAQSKAFRVSMAPPGSNSVEGSQHNSSYMGASAASIHITDRSASKRNGSTNHLSALGGGQRQDSNVSMTPKTARGNGGPRFERVSMHLQHAHTFGGQGTANGGGFGGSHHHIGGGDDDEEILQRLIAVGIVPAAPSPPPPEPANATDRLTRKSGVPLLKRSSLSVTFGGPTEALPSPTRPPPMAGPPTARSGLTDVPEDGGHFSPAPRVPSMPGQGQNNPLARKSSVPVPPSPKDQEKKDSA